MKRIISGKLKQFDVRVPNAVGSLSSVCDALAQSAVNIKAISTGDGFVRLVTEDDATAKDVLDKANFDFTQSEIISLTLMDRPGELAKIAKLLARSGINVDSVYILGKNPERSETHIAIKVNDVPKAMKILGALS